MLNPATFFNLGASGFSPELRAVISRANTEGFTVPPAAILLALDAFIVFLKTVGIFIKLDYLRVSAFGNVLYENFARINIANPSANLATKNSGVTYTVYGFKGNKIDGVLDTGINLSTTTKYVQNSATRLYVLQSPSTNGVGRQFDGAQSGSSNQMSNSNSAGQRINQGTGNLSVSADLSGIGLKAIVRTSSTDVYVYNQAVQTFATRTSSARANANQVEFNGFNVFSDSTHSLTLYASALTATEVADVRSGFNSYLTNPAIGLTAYA